MVSPAPARVKEEYQCPGEIRMPKRAAIEEIAFLILAAIAGASSVLFLGARKPRFRGTKGGYRQ